MNKILAAVVGLAVASTTLLAGTTAAEAAGPTCPQPTYTYVTGLPATLVVSATGSATLSLEAGVTDACHATTEIDALITSPEHSASFALTKVGTEKGVDVWVLDVKLPARGLADAEAGTWKVEVTGRSGISANAALDRSGQFRVLRKAALSAKVSATRVKKNKKVTVSATLTRADWEKRTTSAYGKQKVTLQRKSGKGAYTSFKTLTTSSKGVVTVSLKVTKSGCYRAVFAGNAATSAVTSGSACVTLT